ncbi:MAG: DUF4886 domain-containing protein [Lentisphaeria bacterium]|nr:DUF4886 domain-containing protein [Lentisphaeria bacterium]
MKKIMFVMALAAFALSAAELKVLTIGNSFTWSLQKELPAIVKAQGDKLTLAFANHGGCTIQRHWKYAEAEEAKADVKRYKYNGKAVKLRDILQAEKWDIITIQQASPKSWVKGSFYPELDKLVAYVKKYAPDAEIVFQQTWAYRADHAMLKKTGGQKGMYDGIYNNYKEASAKFGFRVIPAGLAVELAREAQPVKFTCVPDEEIAKARAKGKGSRIEQPGSLFMGWYWGKNRKTKEPEFRCDSIHLNSRGQYLQACVWYGFLFKKSPLDIKYKGRTLKEDDAAMLRKCADKALKEYK